MALNNLTNPSTCTSTSASTGRTSERVRSTVWQYFLRVEVIENEKTVIKTLCNYCERIFVVLPMENSHLKRHADKCIAKNNSNIGLSESQINFLECGDGQFLLFKC